MKSRFTAAITKTGRWLTHTKKGESRSFIASLQPDFRQGGSPKGDTGYGVDQFYTLYLPYTPDTAALQAGEVVFGQKEGYRILTIETIYYQQEPLYRQGTLLAVGREAP